jgi:hypothetical protein
MTHGPHSHRTRCCSKTGGLVARCRLTSLVALLLILLIGWPEASADRALAAERGAADSVLVLYDSLANNTADEGNLQQIERVLASFGQSMAVYSFDRYVPGTLARYPRVLLLRNRPDLQPSPALLGELNEYRGNRLLVSGIAYPSGSSVLAADPKADPLADWASSVHRTVAPSADTEQLLAFAQKLKDWLGIQTPGRCYLVFKEVYPFSDLEVLRSFVGELQEAGIPFALASRPVFANTTYPAMQRYVEALKLAQSDGGSLLVQTPVVKLAANRTDESLHEKMNGFLDVLVASGLAPLGIVSEAYWTFDAGYAAGGLNFFDSAVLLPDGNPAYLERTVHSVRFRSCLYAVELTDFPLTDSGLARQAPPLPIALVSDLPETREGQNRLLAQLRASWLTFADFKDEAHAVRTQHHSVTSSEGRLALDGKPLSIDYVPKAVDNGFEYVRRDPISFARLFRAQNRLFMVIISAALAVFLLLIGLGRRLYKRKFLK